MHPILFTVGDFSVHTYGALGAVAFLFTAGVALYRGKQAGFSVERITDLIFWTAIWSILGSRLLFVYQNPGTASTWFEMINIRTGGLVFYGALLTGLPVGSALMRRYKIGFYEMWDILATAFPISHGISRLGCYAAGCCYGTHSSHSWAVVFPDDPLVAAPENTPLHPVQLYEAGSLFAIGLVVNLVFLRKQRTGGWHGQVMLSYLLLYAGVRTVTEMFRGDAERGYFWPSLLGETLSYSQGVSLMIALFALGVFLVGARRVAVGSKSVTA